MLLKDLLEKLNKLGEDPKNLYREVRVTQFDEIDQDDHGTSSCNAVTVSDTYNEVIIG